MPPLRLQALQKPVLYKDLEENTDAQLPLDIKKLHKRIDDIVVLRLAFLPCSIREEVCSVLGRQVPESWFTAPQSSDNRDQDLSRLRRLQRIVSESRRSRELGRGESGLNWKVHEPLLQLALDQFGGVVESEPSTDARILAAFVPRMQDTNVPTESKIDIALVLDPNAAEGDKPLADLIYRVVMAEPDGKKSSSHTNYQPLHLRPPATFIKTKATGSADEGRTQLGIFVAAQNLRYSSFINRRYATLEEVERPVALTLPHILTSELDWKLYYCCDRRERLDMVGDIDIGDTKNLLGALTLLAVLHEIAKYIAVQFRSWIEDIFSYNE